MQVELQEGMICQSCAMPINKSEYYGTDQHGKRAEEYCKYCFQQGNFTDPQIDVKGMINKCVDIMMHSGVMPEQHIRETLSAVIPSLKRWQTDKAI